MTKVEKRSLADLGEAGDIRPVVALDRGNRSLWIALGLIMLCGLVMLVHLETQRIDRTAPSTRPRASDFSSRAETLPTLYVPPEPISDRPTSAVRVLVPKASDQVRVPSSIAKAISPPSFWPLPPSSAPQTRFPVQPAPLVISQAGPVVVYDISGRSSDSASGAGQSSEPSSALVSARRARAARPANRVTTVPQGTLIPAVLETALDSTQPGQARALVSSDVTNLNGDKVLIPRGSRLYGEYRGEIAPGQNRVQLLWTKLVRPDGSNIELNSPSSDQLGRAGIRGKVNTHFFERLGGALLQSSIDFGAIAASRSVSDSAVVVALPSSAQSAASQLIPSVAKPSIKVKAGSRISVFVAHDLDFSSVETGL
jgi:type IV secretion system protein VirB10